MYSSEEGHQKISLELIKKGSNLNVSDKKTGETILMIWVKKGEKEIVQELLKRKVDVNARSFDGKTALLIASKLGKIRIFNELKNNGADLNVMDKDGNTPIYFWSENGNTEIVQNLIEMGVDIKIKNKERKREKI